MPAPPVAAFDVPMPGTHLRDVDSPPPPATSVTNRPPAPARRRQLVRVGIAVATAAVAIAAGAGVRHTVAPPARRAAASPQTQPGPSSLPPQGLLEVSAADGMQIQVDGIERGRGPKLSISLPEGTHEVKTDGPNGKTRLFEIARGKVTHVDLAWRPAPVPPTR
jgi:hypothetical protein